MENRILAFTCVLPCTDVLIVLVITESLAVSSLHLHTEMTSAGLVPVESVTGHQLTDLEEIRHTESLFKLLVELLISTGNIDILHILGTELVNFLNCLFKAFLVTCHSDLLPHYMTQLLVIVVNSLGPLIVDKVIDTLLDSLLSLVELRGIGIYLRLLNLMREIVPDSVRQDEISVRQTLHEGGSSETVAAVVGEIGLTDSVQTGDSGLEIVVNPDTSHSVVDGGINHHRLLIGIDTGYLLVHLEEVAVTGSDNILAESCDSGREIQEYGKTCLIDTIAGIASLLGGTGSHVAGNKITESRIAALKIVVAVLLGYLRALYLLCAELLDILHLLRNPDTSVITERLTHKGQLGLLVTMNRDTGRVNLGEAGIGEVCSFLVAVPCCRAVGVHGICRKEICVAVTAGSQDYGMCSETLDLTGYKVAGNDTAGLTVYNNELKHLMTGIRLYSTLRDLTVQGSVCSEKELLSGLTAGIESTADLSTSEGAVVKQSTVISRERNTLCYALVDNQIADFCKPVNIGFPAAVVASLDGIVEETVHGVIVVLIIFSGIDTSLRCDRVGAAGRVTDAENLDIITEFSESCGCRGSTKTGTDYDNVQLSFIGRADNTDSGFMLSPFSGTLEINLSSIMYQ